MKFPSMRLDDTVAVVTGGGSGLGRLGALAFANAGADVVLAGRTAAKLEESARQVRELGRRALAVPADITEAASTKRLAEAALGEFGRIDILFNNAGLIAPHALVDFPDDEWRRLMDTNVNGTFLCTKAVAPIMIRQRSGRIINMGSVLSNYGMANRTAYCASKAAIAHMTKALAFELGPHNITVNAIGPTVIFTELNRELATRQPHIYEGLRARTPLGRYAEQEDLAGALVFLASPAASFITGQTLYVDGGYTAG